MNSTNKNFSLSSSFISSSFGLKKISAVGKDIKFIDNDDFQNRKFTDTKALYLSRNLLQNLEGVQNFASLESFSAADNNLARFEDIGALAGCTELKNVCLEDNPVSQMPNYRLHVINMLIGSIKTLDGRPVTPDERRIAPFASHLYSSLLSAAIKTACFVHKIGRSIQITLLHRELFHYTSMGLDHSHALSFPACYYEYGTSLSNNEHALLEHAILNELTQQRNTSSPSSSVLWWHAAFVDVLSRQVNSIHSLLITLANVHQDEQQRNGEMTISVDTLRCTLSAISSVVMDDGVEKIDMLVNEFLEEQDVILSTLARKYSASSFVDNDTLDSASDCIDPPVVETCDQKKEIDTEQQHPPGSPQDSWSIPVGRSCNGDDSDHVCRQTTDDLVEARKERERELQYRVEQLTSEYDNLHIKLSDMKEQMDEKDAVVVLHRQEIASQKNALIALQSWLEAANGATAEAEKALAHERAMHAMDCSALRSEIDHLRAELESMQHVHHTHQEVIAELSMKLELANEALYSHVPEPLLMNIYVSHEHEVRAQLTENEALRNQVKESHQNVLNLKRQLCLLATRYVYEP